MSFVFQKIVIVIIFNLDIILFTNVIAAGVPDLTSDRNSFNIKCQIPDYKPHTQYNVIRNGMEIKNLKPGEDVPVFSILQTVCDKHYQKIPFSQDVLYCSNNGTWSPPVSNCSLSCPPLKSTRSTTVTCHYNKKLLDNCNNPVQETVVTITCNPLYERNVKISPKHNCKNGKWSPVIFPCEPSCGRKHAEGITNIIGGQHSVSGSYPWQVAVYDAQKNFICGGSIIKPHIVLSAAHCFTDVNGIRMPAENYFLAAGKYYSKYDDEHDSAAQYTMISKIYIPDRYRPSYTYQANDISVLILKDPFNITVNVHLVCIELNCEIISLEPSSKNNKGIVTGWGKIEESKGISNELKELEIPIVLNENCHKNVPQAFRQYITSDKICGGYLNQSTGVCGGDSGGGLVFKDYADQYYIKGIVSVSPISSEFQCDANQYSLFTSVKEHINDIQEILNTNQENESIEFSEGSDEADELSTRCVLPKFPPNGKYSIVSVTYKLKLTCDSNYTPDQPLLEYTCSEGQWKPPPAKCARLKWRYAVFVLRRRYSILQNHVLKCIPNNNTIGVCPSLISSTSTNVKCEYNGKPVKNCENPIEGTKALFSCNKFYEESRLLINSILSCEDGTWNSTIPQCYPICGDNSSELYSWHVGIYNVNKEFVCGGSIISPKIILSAAQCLTDYYGAIQPAENYLIAAGKRFREYSDYTDVDAQYSTILQIHIPTIYRGRIVHNAADIAVLILTNALLLSKAVQPVCLDQNERSSNLDTSIYNAGIGEITGWGYIKTTKTFSDVLKELEVTYISTKNCRNELPHESFRMYITYDKMCGKHINYETSVCGGDNGGGLIFYNRNDGRHYIKGILSVASASNEHQCDLKDFSFYTAVGKHLNFLNKIIANHS